VRVDSPMTIASHPAESILLQEPHERYCSDDALEEVFG
jgi:hypothetical protein